MKKTSRRSKRKSTPKVKDNNVKNEPVQEKKEWTPLQLEQVELTKQLENYIKEFKDKLSRLNFKPTDKELVILFVMYLHPRFKRLVEPLEPSLKNWIEAAELAKCHCTRISIILGCERIDTEPMFRSNETKALIQSGYFMSSDTPAKSMYPGTESIYHLLKEEVTTSTTNSGSASSSPVVKNVTLNDNIVVVEASGSNDNVGIESKEIEDTVSTEEIVPVTPVKDTSSAKGTSSVKETATLKDTPSNKETTTVKETLPSPVKETPSTKETTLVDNKVTSTNEEELHTEKPDTIRAQNEDKKGKKVENIPSAMTKSSVQARIQQAVKNKKEKEKKTIIQNKSNGKNSICYRVPEQHSGVNLTFLELEVNGKKVKGLLAKLRWGSSAISLDCVQRLGLEMKETNGFGIITDFGDEDTIGILKLPIVHPADPNIKSEMEIQVLPMIYGGKIELVLGADFFYYFNPTLNIKSRAIRFMDKETPYIVSKI